MVLIALVGLVAVIALPSSSGTSGPSSMSSGRLLHVGINAHTRGVNPGEDQDQVAETGAVRLREDIEWDLVEPSDDAWSWGQTDKLFGKAAERGMTILPLLVSSPCWAVPRGTDEDDCWSTYPVADAEYAEYVAQVAARYGPDGDFWDAQPGLDGDLAPGYLEIWNESYLPQFTNDEVNPARYAALYKAAVTAGRAANPATRYLIQSVVAARVKSEIDPKGWVDWAEGLVEAEPALGDYIDGLTVHPYPGSNAPGHEPRAGTENAFLNLDVGYERWREVGVDKPVWITEVGYSSCEGGSECVPGETQAERERRKAEWLTEIFDELGEDEYAYVDAVYLYTFRQRGDAEEPNGNKEKWFGILDEDGRRLPAWSSFATAVAEYDGASVPTRR